MNQIILFASVVILLFILMLALMEVGRRIGVRRRKQEGEVASEGLSAIDGAVFGLMGLLVAFTFSGAAARFDSRRDLIVKEANDIGTAYLRIDLLPLDSQPGLRNDFRNYLDARLDYYQNRSVDQEAAKTAVDRFTALQTKIWSDAVAACAKATAPSTPSLVLSAIDDMIDITTTRSAALEMHPPAVVFWSLGVLVLASAFLSGYGMAKGKTRNLLHMMVYSVILATAVYVILDLEYPRVGLIRIDAADHYLVDLRSTMK